jgi:CDP-L-myo-inositol myo-inositolphosphotransferase
LGPERQSRDGARFDVLETTTGARCDRMDEGKSHLRDHLAKLPVVILAAGEGSRLQNEVHITPKPLTPLLGLTLLERSILTCCQAGVREFLVVVGHRKDEIHPHIKALQEKHDLSIRVVENPDWEVGNGASVSACAPYLSGPFFLLMCDHLFEPEILQDLVAADDGTAVCRLAVDRRVGDVFDSDGATMVHLEGEAITAIGKGLKNPDAVDTGFFLCRPLLFPALEKAQQQGEGSLSAGVHHLIDCGKVQAVDVSGRFWHDVDTPESLNTGEELLLARVKSAKLIDGPVSRHINRFFSIRLTRRLAPYPITPNQISVVSTLTGLAGAACFFGVGFVTAWPPLLRWMLMALAGLTIQVSSILDGVDGEIARLKYQASPYGAYLEYMLDRYVDGLTVMGMVYASYALTGSFSIVLAGFLALIGLPLSSIHRAKFLAETKRNYLDKDEGLLRHLPYSRDVRLFTIFLGGITNQIALAMYFLALVPNLGALLRLYTVKKAMAK